MFAAYPGLRNPCRLQKNSRASPSVSVCLHKYLSLHCFPSGAGICLLSQKRNVMATSARTTPGLKFGPFELDLRTGELSRDGRKLRLQGQPVRVLSILASRAGQLVTREELRAELWPEDTFVDFDHGLNNSVNRIREALGDSASAPKYIETLPKQGYRFVAEIRASPTIAPPTQLQSAEHVPAAPDEELGGSRRVRWEIPVAGLVLIGLAVVGTLYWTRNSRERWAWNQALPEIVRLMDEGKKDQAFQLALRAKPYIPNDPVLLRTLRVFMAPISIRTTPGGADIYVRT